MPILPPLSTFASVIQLCDDKPYAVARSRAKINVCWKYYSCTFFQLQATSGTSRMFSAFRNSVE